MNIKYFTNYICITAEIKIDISPLLSCLSINKYKPIIMAFKPTICCN